MQMLYNSDSYAVMLIDVPADEGQVPGRGGYEIVDKFGKKDIFIAGALAEVFKAGVERLIESDPSPEAFEAFIEGYTTLAHQPLALH